LGNINLFLYDSQDNLIASDLSSGTNSKGVNVILEPLKLDYLVQIVIVSGYALNAEFRVSSLSCESRYPQFTNNHNFSTASLISLSYTELSVCSETPNYYAVDMSNNTLLMVTITFNLVEGSIMLAVYDQNQNLVMQGIPGTSPQSVSVTSTPQTYYIKITPLSKYSVTYDMAIVVDNVALPNGSPIVPPAPSDASFNTISFLLIVLGFFIIMMV